MKKINTALILCLLPFFAFSQQILGAELNRHVLRDRAGITAIVVTESVIPTGKVVDWGDGQSDTLITGITYPNNTGNQVSHLWNFHYYSEPGTYQIQIADLGTWSEQIVNIEDPGSIPFILEEEVVIVPQDTLAWWSGPSCYASLNSFTLEEGGIVLHDFICTQIPLAVGDSITYTLVPPVQEGYTFPEATTELSCCIHWDRPVDPGVYAFAVEADLWAGGEIIGNITRYLSLEIHEYMLVGENSILTDAPTVSISPNPASETLHLQLSHAQAEKALLRVMNLQGQTLHQEKLQLSPAMQEHQIDLRGWPSGVYVLSIQAEGSAPVVRRFVVE